MIVDFSSLIIVTIHVGDFYNSSIKSFHWKKESGTQLAPLRYCSNLMMMDHIHYHNYYYQHKDAFLQVMMIMMTIHLVISIV